MLRWRGRMLGTGRPGLVPAGAHKDAAIIVATAIHLLIAVWVVMNSPQLCLILLAKSYCSCLINGLTSLTVDRLFVEAKT